eukprot:12201742-Ditylum_brightwellii.AAC.1
MACQSDIALDAAFAVAGVAKEARCLTLAVAAIAVHGGGFFLKLALLITAFNVQVTEFVKGINFDLLVFPLLTFFLGLIEGGRYLGVDEGI